jgi:hypothetical protein
MWDMGGDDMKIKLKKPTSMIEKKGGIGTYYDVEIQAMGEIERTEMMPEPKLNNKITLDFPANIVDTQDHELGNLHSYFTSLACYAETITAQADNDVIVAEAELEHIKAKLYLMGAGNETVQEAKSRVQTHPDFIRWNRRYLVRASVYKLSKSKLEVYNKKCQCISREITRRSNSFPQLTKDVQ